MNVSELSDTQLNLMVVKLSFGEDCFKDKDLVRAYNSGRLNYLKDWNLLMPLAVRENLIISFMNSGALVNAKIFNESPARAICEILVIKKLEEKA